MHVWTPHSTALHVSWNEVPNGYKNGIIRGYKVKYKEMKENSFPEIEDLEPWERSLRITGLRKFTLYNITVLAYTSKGDGVSSNKVLKTDQDGMFAIFQSRPVPAGLVPPPSIKFGGTYLYTWVKRALRE